MCIRDRPIVGYGLIYNLWLCVLGGLLILGGLYGWVFEPVDDPNADSHDHHDDQTEGTELVEGDEVLDQEVTSE